MHQLEALGYAWIANKRRPFYSSRIIKRGEHKGEIEIQVRARGNVLKLLKVKPAALNFFGEVDYAKPNK